MESDSLKEILLSLKQIDARLDYLERRMGISQDQIDKSKSLAANGIPAKNSTTVIPKPRPATSSQKVEEKPSNLLGIVGVCCLIVAMILLIKFSIDSGWLTPVRQLILAGLFGSALVSVPFFFTSKEKDYFSLLPSAGVIVLHLTVYGGVYYHKILDPMIATGLIWGIGFLSIYLLKKFEEDVYALLSIAGIYIGSLLVKDSFQDLSGVAGHIFIWDIIFVHFAINLKKRFLIAISAYFALFLVAMYGVSVHSLSTDMAIQLAVIQIIQMLVFMIGIALYSVKNSTMTEKEVIQLFPVFIFFYGLVFYYLDVVGQVYATSFSLIFAFLILGVRSAAIKKTGTDKLESTHLIYSLVAVVLIHSIYFVNLDDLGRVISGFLVMICLGLFHERMKAPDMKGVFYLTSLVVVCSMLIVLNGPDTFSTGLKIVSGLAFSLPLLAGYKKTSFAPLLAIANVMIVVAIVRLGDMIGEIWIGPLSVLYAFACLIFALKSADKLLAQGSLPVIFFAIGRFVFFNFADLSQGERIISLLIMGGLIYSGGFVYRKIPEK